MKTKFESIIIAKHELSDRLHRNEERNYLSKSIELDKQLLNLIKGMKLPDLVNVVKSIDNTFIAEFAVGYNEKDGVYALEDIVNHGVSKAIDSEVFMIESNNDRFTQTTDGFHQLYNRRLVDNGIYNPFSKKTDEMPVFDRKI